MHEDTVRTSAFAMPLTSPAYPSGPIASATANI